MATYFLEIDLASRTTLWTHADPKCPDRCHRPTETFLELHQQIFYYFSLCLTLQSERDGGFKLRLIQKLKIIRKLTSNNFLFNISVFSCSNLTASNFGNKILIKSS